MQECGFEELVACFAHVDDIPLVELLLVGQANSEHVLCILKAWVLAADSLSGCTGYSPAARF